MGYYEDEPSKNKKIMYTPRITETIEKIGTNILTIKSNLNQLLTLK